MDTIYVLFQVKECALTRYSFTKCVTANARGYHFNACVHLFCSFLIFSLVRLVVGVAVLAVGVAVLDVHVVVVVSLAVGVAVLAVGVAVFSAGVAMLLAVVMLDVRPAPLTASTLMV